MTTRPEYLRRRRRDLRWSSAPSQAQRSSSAQGSLLPASRTLRSGTWHSVGGFVPLATGIWCLLLIQIQFIGALQVGVGIMVALQVAFGVALVAEES